MIIGGAMQCRCVASPGEREDLGNREGGAVHPTDCVLVIHSPQLAVLQIGRAEGRYANNGAIT